MGKGGKQNVRRDESQGRIKILKEKKCGRIYWQSQGK